VLFNEPKLLKYEELFVDDFPANSFSALQRAEIAEMFQPARTRRIAALVSVLFNEPKLLKQ